MKGGGRRPPHGRDRKPPGGRPSRGPRRDAPRRGAPPRSAPQNTPQNTPQESRRPAPPPASPAALPPGARLIDIEELTVRVEKLVAGGEGLARYEGVPIFVLRAAPGDLLRVRLVERRPDYGRAEIVEILEPGPDRRSDPFPELSRSGAADLQHLADRMQARLKAQAARETLERIGRLELPAEIEVVTGDPWHYRLRTQLHTEVDPVAGGVRVGYHARGTHDLIPLSRCPLLVPELEAVLAELPAHLGPGGPRRIDLAAGDDGAVTLAPVVPGLPQGEVTLRVGDFTYGYDARCFFQSHRGLLPQLVELAVGSWTGETAVDLYGGVGLFGLPLARRYRRVITVEGDRIAARYARLNVRRNRLDNVEAVSQAVESWLPHLPLGVDRVVVDPPRTGLSDAVREALLEAQPRRLTYVSCHAATLARDLQKLAPAFTLESITFIDMFPQTGHLETVVQLTGW